MTNPILLRQTAMTPGMLEDLSSQYNTMLNPILEPAEDPSFNAVRQEAFARNAAMQNNQLPASPMTQAEMPSMIPDMPSNQMFTPEPNLQEQMLAAIAQGVAAPEGQAPLQDFVGNNWMNLLSSGLQGLEENRLAARLPVAEYMQYKREKQQDELARQDRLLNSFKLQTEIDLQRQALDLERERVALDRQKILTGQDAPSGSSFMQDARILMQNDPSLDLNTAYGISRSGLPRGIVAGAGGTATQMPGFAEAVAGLKGEEETAQQLAQTRATAFTEGQLSLPKVISKANTFETKNASIENKAKSLQERASNFTTGFGGSLLSAVPGTPAFDLAKDTETLLANAGFTELQEMRDNSPTGGALGQVAVQELGMLQAAQQNLLTSQSKEQYLRNLADFIEIRKGTARRLRAAAERDKALFGGTFEQYEKTLNTGMAPFLEQQKAAQPAPQSIDPALLEFMTPEERALFQ